MDCLHCKMPIAADLPNHSGNKEYHSYCWDQHRLNDAGLLIRRLCSRMKDCKVKEQAYDWLNRNGLSGSILKDT